MGRVEVAKMTFWTFVAQNPRTNRVLGVQGVLSLATHGNTEYSNTLKAFSFSNGNAVRAAAL